MYDDTFDNTAWATVSSGLFVLDQVNHMEREMLSFLDFKLFIKPSDWIQFTDKLILQIIPEPPKMLPTPMIMLEQRPQFVQIPPAAYPNPTQSFDSPFYRTGAYQPSFGTNAWLTPEDFNRI